MMTTTPHGNTSGTQHTTPASMVATHAAVLPMQAMPPKEFHFFFDLFTYYS